ncbi:nucleolar DEAD-box protein required for synthesis of 60S ribosomal subunit [Exophiala bonariae]|uniref:RNA helicase n=1 Tax=Exophiala bonariae TaxID=1690606 RepID=A0AAV9N2C0_9EURO|nr:nucleolar DEAD-box protein required for synthesis of 60S ribosomal subunit [Exophiala bonariae]
MGPSKREDDFVFTLSDDDGQSIHSEAESDSPVVPTAGQKRKREDVGITAAAKKGKKNKPNKKVKRVEEPELPESESDEEQGVQDRAIDPDFEFDLGDNAVLEEVEEFDGWGNGDATKSKGASSKKGVDLDDIIARRAAKTSKTQTKAKSEEQASSENGSEEEDGNDSDDGSEPSIVMPDFDDDELVAPDTFGAGVDHDEEEEPVSEAEQDDEQDSEDEDASDDDSVASPTAHPDDLASDQSDAESETSKPDREEQAKREAFFAPEDKTKQPSTKTTSSFQQFSLSRPILKGLTSLSFTAPTPIQVRAIPVALQGLDVVGSAVTGSGKTAAFLLPILERLLYRPRKVPTTRVAILMPTRELAVQCYNVATALARYTDITFAQVVGGFSLREQETILKKRPDVVIATPGRFIDHMRNSASFAVENIEILVLDEADRMLETGFEDELNEILKTIPKSRQTMLFSATMTDSVDKLVRVGMNRPVRLSVDAKKTTTAGLVQEFVRLRPGRESMRLATLCLLCKNVFNERTIVFFRQKKEAHRVRIVLGLLGVKAGELHGSMSQEQRISSVNAFREGKMTHLLATDLASRGLDIKNVMTVVNYEAPQTHEIYLHRVGRTARAGRSGRACTIAAEPDRKVVKAAVKSGRTQGAKIVSRAMESNEVDEMHARVEDMEADIEAILKEEKEEKQLAQVETQITRGENLVKHEAEIMARPRRTWFESEKDKRDAKQRGHLELNAPNGGSVRVKSEKKKLSNKDKKRLDDRKDRVEGKMWRKGKGSEALSKREKQESKSAKKSKAGGSGGAVKGAKKGKGKGKARR